MILVWGSAWTACELMMIWTRGLAGSGGHRQHGQGGGGELPIVTRPEGGPYMTDPARRPEVRSALMSRGIARTGPVARRFGDAYTSLGVE